MKKLLPLLCALCLVPYLSSAQSFLDEDFSTGSVTTPPTGWTQNVIAGDAAVDLWHFDNPGAQTLNAPISDPAAIFDSDFYSDNSQAEDVALESPVMDLTSATVVKLAFDHFFEDGAGGAYDVEVYDGTAWVSVLSGSVVTANPQSEEIDISAQVAGISNAQVRFRWTGDWSFWWIVDNVKVFQPSPDDIGITSVDSPLSGCLSSTEPVTVTIKNFGTTAQTGFAVGYSLNLGTPVVETYNGAMIMPDSSASFTFTTTADLSTAGAYTIAAATGLLTDGDNTNDTTSVVVNSLTPVSAFVGTFEDFETWTTGSGTVTSPGTTANGWINSGGDYPWTIDAGGTGSGNTGPTVDHTLGTAGGIYIYTEASPSTTGETYEIQSPCLDLSSFTNPGLEFWYHMAGDDMGTLEIDVIAGGVATNVFTLSGTQQNAQADPWLRGTANLVPWIGQTIQLVFRGIRGPGFESDIALDDIGFYELPVVDMSANALLHPVDGTVYPCGTLSDSVVVEIINKGLAAIDFSVDNTDVTAEFTGAAANNYTTTLTSGTLGIGDTMMVTVTTTANISAGGTYNVRAYTTVGGDGDPLNDTTATSMVTTVPTAAASVGVFEDFETFTTGSGNTTNPGTTANGWINAGGTFPWTIDAGGTGSSNTGPLVDHTLGTSAGIYIYTEATSGSQGDTYEILSPCIDISALNFPGLDFWYHMAGTTMGTLEVDVIAGGTATNVFTISGTQQPNQSDPYTRGTASLLPWKGQTIQLLFRGIKGSSFESDIAIDDIGFYELPSTDMSASAILYPTDGSIFPCGTTSDSVVVEIINKGLADIDFSVDNTDVTVDITGAAANVYSTTLSSGMLPIGDTMMVTVTTTADFSVGGDYNLRAYTTVSGDGDPLNDTTGTSVVTTVPTIAGTIGVIEDFETFVTGSGNVTNPGTTANGWINSGGDYPWTIDAGGTGSSDTGPTGDHTLGTSSGIYIYTEASSPTAQGETFVINSPCVDLGALNAPILEFWYHMHGQTMGTLEVDVVDGGVATTVWSLSGEQQAVQTDPYLKASIPLGAYAGNTVQFVFRGIRGADFWSDIAIDDITLAEAPAVDAALTSLGGSANFVCADSAFALDLTVTNDGSDTLDLSKDNLIVTLDVTGPINQTFTDTVDMGMYPWTSSLTVGFAPDMSMPGTYTATAYIDNISGDANTGNDTIVASFEARPTVNAYPYVERFADGPAGWIAGGTNSSWEFGLPQGSIIDTSASDTNSWVTNLTGPYNGDENSWVLSPCFDMTGTQQGAWVSMSVWWTAENSWDGSNLQSSTDGGATWTNIGDLGDPDNWYNDGTINGNPGGSQIGWTGTGTNSSGGWVQAKHPLDSSVIGQSSVFFRVTFGSDGGGSSDGFAFDDFVIAQAPVVDLGADSAVLCLGETLDAGMFPGATYLWNDSSMMQTIVAMNTTGTDIVDSTISVTVTDSLGLTGSDQAVVTIPASVPMLSAAVTQDVNCFGDSTGSAMATVMGGSGTIQYLWDTNPASNTPMISGVPAGTYTVTVVDSFGCGSDTSIMISQPASAVGAATDSTTNVNCPDDSTGAIFITPSGGTAPYTFMWSNGATTEDLVGVPAGDYTGTVTDSLGCDITSPVISVTSANNNPVASFTQDTVGATINFSSTSTDADSIIWDFGDSTIVTNAMDTAHTFTSNDTFTVTLTVFNECGMDVATATIVITNVGIEDELRNRISVYPNPSNGIFDVNFDDLNLENVTLAVTTIEGKYVYKQAIGQVYGQYTQQIQLPQVAKGIYLLQIQTQNAVVHKRISIE